MVEKQRNIELYRDEEYRVLFRWGIIIRQVINNSPPHDHGQHWVVYGVYSGKLKFSTYRMNESAGKLQSLQTQRLTSGVIYAYLPGEIHSTCELHPDGSAVLRFLSTDLKKVKRTL